MSGVVSALGGKGPRRRKRGVWVIASLTVWSVIGGRAGAGPPETPHERRERLTLDVFGDIFGDANSRRSTGASS